MWRVQLRRRAGCRSRLGCLDPLQRRPARAVRDVPCRWLALRARRLQRLPDARPAQGDHPRCRTLAALRAQCERTVRGAPGHAGSARLAIAVLRGHGGIAHPGGRRAHGEGRTGFDASGDAHHALASVRFVDNRGRATEAFPLNSNGSANGSAGFTNADGRVTILMPHPERVFRSVQMSWHPREWGRGFAVDAHVPQCARVGGLGPGIRDSGFGKEGCRGSGRLFTRFIEAAHDKLFPNPES